VVSCVALNDTNVEGEGTGLTVVVTSGNSTIAAGLSDCDECCSLGIDISVDADFEDCWEVTELVVEECWEVTELEECWDANELIVECVELDVWNCWAVVVVSVLAVGSVWDTTEPFCNKVVNSKDATPAVTIEAVDGIVDCSISVSEVEETLLISVSVVEVTLFKAT